MEEAALLVGMINGPGVYNPRRYPKAALDRRNLVINRMVENSNLTAAEGAKPKALPINLRYKKWMRIPVMPPYFRGSIER